MVVVVASAEFVLCGASFVVLVCVVCCLCCGFCYCGCFLVCCVCCGLWVGVVVVCLSLLVVGFYWFVCFLLGLRCGLFVLLCYC